MPFPTHAWHVVCLLDLALPVMHRACSSSSSHINPLPTPYHMHRKRLPQASKPPSSSIIMTGNNAVHATFRVYSKIHSDVTPYLSVASDHVSVREGRESRRKKGHCHMVNECEPLGATTMRSHHAAMPGRNPGLDLTHAASLSPSLLPSLTLPPFTSRPMSPGPTPLTPSSSPPSLPSLPFPPFPPFPPSPQVKADTAGGDHAVWTVEHLPKDHVALRAHNGHYLSINSHGQSE